jgi:hypothetical protein
VEKKDSQLDQRWAMLYFFGAWILMELLIHLVYMVSCCFLVSFFIAKCLC